MAVDPSGLAAGRCYLAHDGRVRRIVEIIGDDNVNYELRSAQQPDGWQPGPPLSSRLDRAMFAAEVSREVGCSYRPDDPVGGI